jgi:hypothetical protein
MSNFLEKYIEFCCDLTDAPKRFHEFMGYVILGVLLGRDVYLPFGAEDIFPNFYLALIAPSSRYRKTTALKIASKLIRLVDTYKVLPSEFSQEKLVEILQLQNSGAFIFYEFKTLLGILEKDYMQGCKAFLTELFDNPDQYVRRTKAQDIVIDKPNISIISATTLGWFNEMVKEGDMEGGFLNRFVFVPVKIKEKSMPIPEALDPERLQGLKLLLIDIMKQFKGKKMVMTDSAKEMYCNWYKASEDEMDFDDEDNGFKASATRLQIYLIKFAMLIAINDDRSTFINDEHLLKAIRLVDWLKKQAHGIVKVVSGGKVEKQFRRIIEVINKQGGSCSWRQLLQQTHIKTRDLMELITTMEERGDIKREMEKEKGHGTVIKLA